MSPDRLKVKDDVVHTYKGLLLSHEKMATEIMPLIVTRIELGES